MATELPFEMLENALLSAGLLKYHPPMTAHQNVTVLPFGPYEAGGGNWSFRTCLRFETSDEPLRTLYAMTAGSIFFHPAQSNSPAKVILKRADSLGIILLKQTGILPVHVRAPLYIIYENVDPAAARQAALGALAAGSRAHVSAKLLKRRDPEFVQAEAPLLPGQLADLWLLNKIPDGLYVEGGEVIGRCGPATAGASFSMELRMADSVDPPPPLFHNPAYQVAQWEEKGWLKGFALPPELTDITAPPTATGGLKLVSGGGSSQITDALAAASPGDTVLILDNQTYTDAVVIDQNTPFSVTSVAAPGDHANYPRLSGGGVHRPVTITNNNNAAGGIVFVGKLIVENGMGTGSRHDGGGVLIERANHAFISNCVVRNCHAPGTGPAEELLNPALFGEGFGGGIAVYHASPAILGCLVENNEARGRGKGIGVFGYGWPTIFDCTVRSNGLNSGGGRKDGGGVGVQIAVPNTENPYTLQLLATKANLPTHWDDDMLERARANYVRIIRSKLISNNAEDDGGGLYVTVMSGALLRDTVVSGNQAGSNGGGVRVTMASRLVTRGQCVIENNVSNKNALALDSGGAGGGGVAARNAVLIDLSGTKVLNNTATGWAGGGLSVLSSDEGTDETAQTMGITYDWNDILWDVYDFKEAVLSIDASCFFQKNKATKLAGQGDHGKGAAIYLLRLLGPRESGFPLPPDKEQDGLLKALPLKVSIERTSVLDVDNTASFPGSDRLYLQDQTVPTEVLDGDLAQAESSGKQDFSYPA